MTLDHWITINQYLILRMLLSIFFVLDNWMCVNRLITAYWIFIQHAWSKQLTSAVTAVSAVYSAGTLVSTLHSSPSQPSQQSTQPAHWCQLYTVHLTMPRNRQWGSTEWRDWLWITHDGQKLQHIRHSAAVVGHQWQLGSGTIEEVVSVKLQITHSRARCYFPSIWMEIYSAKRLFSVHNANPNT